MIENWKICLCTDSQSTDYIRKLTYEQAQEIRGKLPVPDDWPQLFWSIKPDNRPELELLDALIPKGNDDPNLCPYCHTDNCAYIKAGADCPVFLKMQE